MENIKSTELDNDMILFGGRGNAATNTAHILQSGKGNLCGTPALSTNWVRINNIQEAGCKECIEEFHKLKSK